jgi:hypothetical protein
MENTFILNPEATLLDIKDAINERIAKVKALITQSLDNIFSDDEAAKGIDPECLGTILSTVNDFIAEIDLLSQRL